MNTKIEAVIAIAESEIAAGAGELGGNNSGPFVAKYLKPAGLKPPQPWCAAFVSWCLRQAHVRFPYFVSVMKLLDWCRRKGLLVEQPQRGCLAFWKRRGAGLGHLGIVTTVKGRLIETIEGNRGPKVAKFNHAADSPLAYSTFVQKSVTKGTSLKKW